MILDKLLAYTDVPETDQSSLDKLEQLDHQKVMINSMYMKNIVYIN